MKKVWNILFFVFVLCLYGGVFVGCSDDMDNNDSINKDGKVRVSVQFDTRSSNGTEISNDAQNDNEWRIETIRVYAFDGNVLDNMVYKDNVNNTTGIATVDMEINAGNRTFYAIINEPNVPDIHSALALANHPNGIKQVQYQIVNYLKSSVDTTKIANILKKTETEKYMLPMYGVVTHSISSSGTTPISIPVNRAVARIDVYMAKKLGIDATATTTNATLEVSRPSQTGYIAFDNVRTTQQNKSYSVDNPVDSILKNNDNGYTKIYSFYVPEQTCPTKDDRLAFTLGGIKWDGKPTDYNSFLLGDDSKHLLDTIARNTVYQIYCNISPKTKDIDFEIITQPWTTVTPQDSILHPGTLDMTNCYIVSPGRSVSIPIINVYKIWNWQFKQTLDATAELEAEVIWQDTQDLITSVIPVTEGDNTDYSHYKLQVRTTPGKSGNALVGMRLKGDTDSTYRWSWHIWVTDYDPSKNPMVFNGIVTMDRHLGALTNNYSLDGKELGYLYQFGRKDPFPTGMPGTSEVFPLYDKNNMQTSLKIINNVDEDNLINSIKNPKTIYTSSKTPFDWYTTNGNKQNDYLWETKDGRKNIFDPCPQGWKVMSADFGKNPFLGFNIYIDWDVAPDMMGIYGDILGYYPYVNLRNYTNGSFLYQDTNYMWGALVYSRNPILGSCIVYSGIQDLNVVSKQRANSLSVRCVKE